MPTTPPDSLAPARNVVLGAGSTVWRKLATEHGMAGWAGAAIGHRELRNFAFTAQDRVWVLAYSRIPAENQAMLQHLANAGVLEVVYLSSSSTIACQQTACWEYPRVKAQAAAQVLAMPRGRVLTVGLVYGNECELPAGRPAATSYAQLAEFMRTPSWPAGDAGQRQLFALLERPFSSNLEAWAQSAYLSMQRACGAWPCLLRPIDLLLRARGWRWYGYTALSNRLWAQTRV